MELDQLQGEAREEQLIALYYYIEGFTEGMGAEDQSDGAWLAMHEDAVESYNHDFKDSVDWYDIMPGYFEWKNNQGGG